MADVPQNPDTSSPHGVSPDTLVLGFSRSKIMLGIGIAIAVHVVLILATSVTYIRDRWIDPEGAAKRKAAAPAVVAAQATEAPKTPSTASPTAKSPEEARKDTPVMKGITELPKKGEIPKAPDDLGISIKETNR